MRATYLVLIALSSLVSAACAEVTINTAFPGGNALVQKSDGQIIELAPDLRGGKPWFYWYFEARAAQPQHASFVFSRPGGTIGVRGPAISHDEGKTWQWLGADQVTQVPRPAEQKLPPQESFSYEFTKPDERVRFSVGIPYVQSHFDAFLQTQKGNPLLKRSVLTKSRKQRPVELLQIGDPAPGKLALLLTARHHACEALASYILEGFLREALSGSPAAVEFRRTHVLFAVPFVDKDGVEDGDQGKNREPHDHNRDYGDAPIYPEVAAIQALAEKGALQLTIDLHCPALKGDIHEAFHFLGLGVPHVKSNLDEWIAWIGEERPPAVMSPLDYLIDAAKPDAINRAINSHYFATREGVLMAATLEIPYTQPKLALDADMARAYGAGLLRALNHPEFITAAPEARRAFSHADLLTFREGFLKLYRSKPQEAEESAQRYLDDAKASTLLRIEARNLLGLLRVEQRRYADGRALLEATLHDGQAMTSQLTFAHTQRLRLLAADPQTTPGSFAESFAEAMRIPYLSPLLQAGYRTAAIDFYQGRRDFREAIEQAQELTAVAADYEKGKTMNRLAGLFELNQQPAEALAIRQKAVTLLRQQLGPAPARNVFAAIMVTELFDAVMAIPTSTREEKQSAAEMVLNHDIVAPLVKNRVRKALEAP